MHLGFKRKFHKENCFRHTNQFLLDLLIVKSPHVFIAQPSSRIISAELYFGNLNNFICDSYGAFATTCSVYKRNTNHLKYKF